MTYPSTLLLNKPAGLTPLQALELFKQQYPAYKEQTLSYAGRLDPMAEGLLLILVNDENKKRHEYEDWPKTYEFEFLLGYSTDSYDVMGLITEHKDIELTRSLDSLIHNWITTFQGEQTISYPPYSSKPVNGHPLYWYAKRNLLHTILIPEQHIVIDSLTITTRKTCSAETIYNSIRHRLTLVKGNFRQADIFEQWKKVCSTSRTSFPLYTCLLSCKSGTYVRGIVNQLSKDLELPMLTYTIRRKTIGPYSLDQSTVFTLV